MGYGNFREKLIANEFSRYCWLSPAAWLGGGAIYR